MNAPTMAAGTAVGIASAVALAAQEAAAAADISRSTADVIQIIGAVSAAAVVIGGVIVQIITARMKVAVANAVAPVALAVAEVKMQGDGIQHSVDGTASRMEATLAAALRENERLRADKVDQKEIIIAQATAAPAAMTGQGPAASLVQIDQNTADTAKNTARVEAKVEDLAKKGDV